MVVHLVRKLGGSVTQAFIAGGLFACEPVSIFLANLVLTETLFLLEIVAAVFVMAEYWHTRQVRWLVIAASVLGLAALTRPISQFLPIFWLPLFALAPENWRSKLRHGLLFLAVYLLWISPWLLRNWQGSQLVMLSNISHQNLVYYRAKAVLMDAVRLSEQQALAQLQAPLPMGAAYPQQMRAEEQRALQVFLRYPLETGKMTLKGAARLLLDPGYSPVCTLLDRNSLSHECFPGQASMLAENMASTALAHFLSMSLFQQTFLAWGVLITGGLYLGGCLGAWRWLRERRWFHLYLLAGTAGYYLALAAGAESDYRLRAPALPFLAVLAGLALASSAFYRKRGNL
jgi:hypothetical protein